MPSETLEEKAYNTQFETPTEEKTELAQVFENLDDDRVDPKTQRSKIDMNAVLTNTEAVNCSIFDELKAMGLLPQEANITLGKKRTSVSVGGRGRSDKVTIASCNESAKIMGKAGGMAGFFGLGGKKE
jgi:hypothetical protein